MIGVGVERCTRMKVTMGFLCTCSDTPGTDACFGYNAQRHRQTDMDRQTDRQTLTRQ